MCLVNLLFLIVLIQISVQDIKEQKINNKYQWELLFLAIIKISLREQKPIFLCLAGAVVVSVPMLIIALLFRGAIGGGDIKLMSVTGLYIGYERIVKAAVTGLLLSGIYAVYLLLFRKGSGKTKFPVGPFLCAGIVVSQVAEYII